MEDIESEIIDKKLDKIAELISFCKFNEQQLPTILGCVMAKDAFEVLDKLRNYGYSKTNIAKLLKKMYLANFERCSGTGTRKFENYIKNISPKKTLERARKNIDVRMIESYEITLILEELGYKPWDTITDVICKDDISRRFCKIKQNLNSKNYLVIQKFRRECYPRILDNIITILNRRATYNADEIF